MSDEYILDDVVETFSDEDTLMSDIRNNPVKWLLSVTLNDFKQNKLEWIAMSIFLGLGIFSSLLPSNFFFDYFPGEANTADPSPLGAVLWVLSGFSIYVHILTVPFLTSYYNLKKRYVFGSFIGLSGSILLASNLPNFIFNGNDTELFSLIGAALCIPMTVPMLLALKNKKKLLDPGKERITWCTLLSTAILVYAMSTVGTFVEDISSFACGEQAYGSECEGQEEARYGTFVATVAAISWAWPRGKKSHDPNTCPNCGNSNCCLFNQNKSRNQGGNVASGLFIAMGESTNADGIARFSEAEANKILAELNSKNWGLPTGLEWIITGVSCQDDAGALLSEVDAIGGATDSCDALQYRYGGSANDTQQDRSASTWPRGKKIIDDLSDDFLDGLKD